jgi:hypothetical protein
MDWVFKDIYDEYSDIFLRRGVNNETSTWNSCVVWYNSF